MAQSTDWRRKHLSDGDEALARAGALLAGPISQHEISKVDALIQLARAHYRAVEVDNQERGQPR
jgi:hypothetical protein